MRHLLRLPFFRGSALAFGVVLWTNADAFAALNDLVATGFAASDTAEMIALRDRQSVTTWYRVGVPGEDGLLIERYDVQKQVATVSQRGEQVEVPLTGLQIEPRGTALPDQFLSGLAEQAPMDIAFSDQALVTALAKVCEMGGMNLSLNADGLDQRVTMRMHGTPFECLCRLAEVFGLSVEAADDTWRVRSGKAPITVEYSMPAGADKEALSQFLNFVGGRDGAGATMDATTGTIRVVATSARQKMVEKYLAELQKSEASIGQVAPSPKSTAPLEIHD